MYTYFDKKTKTTRCRQGDAKPAWIVKSVVPRDDYTLLLTFIRGEKKLFDMKPLIDENKMYKPIEDITFFKKAHIDGPTVAWSSEIDIAPESLYDQGIEIGITAL